MMVLRSSSRPSVLSVMSVLGFSSFLLLLLFVWGSESLTLSSRLVHRFSDEVAVAAVKGTGAPPLRRSLEFYEVLVKSDLARRNRRFGGSNFSMLFPSEGSETMSLGNDFGWLHYTWIDLGTPKVSFLVALDAGSDLLWVPCDCIQCAPLSGYQGSLVKDLGIYSPAESRTSKNLSCNHKLCASGPNCENPNEPCPYTIDYYSENTTSSGVLVEDKLYLATATDKTAVQAEVIIGCGRNQSGGYLDGIAPDGLLGLGLGEISLPSILAKAGLVRNSFSMCFREDDSGRILFGDQGVAKQKSTPFVPLSGKYVTYIVEVESFCIGAHCLGKSGFQALVDSGSSFTFLPSDVYKSVSQEFDKQVKAPRLEQDAPPWEYCYKASLLEMPKVPSVILSFAANKSFEVTYPLFPLYSKEGGLVAVCLAVQSSGETLGTIGQNFMKGYKMVFDRENLKLGWSRSDCNDLNNSRTVPLTPPSGSQNRPENPLPSDQQWASPNGTAVSPAVAVRAPTNNSAATSNSLSPSLLLLLLVITGVSIFSIG
ncbi:Aspartic peptidase A1 family protein [Dioscorea alata]|uniref:Aspartic peptidase A1 family protein n=2 Tax=Dioscorea alata TaxID=55571 RepID=A0ACB7W8V5_DIOAL|nr:Aspartic peptidase A1 family protein [Dioscorea alata]KAH7683878.1 Aspartic peptidase A1 family protein [Dioscorea alata]